jgi:hypothetical protein
MNFTYLQHPSTSFFNGKLHLLITTHFHCTLQEMSLVQGKKRHMQILYFMCYIFIDIINVLYWYNFVLL